MKNCERMFILYIDILDFPDLQRFTIVFLNPLLKMKQMNTTYAKCENKTHPVEWCKCDPGGYGTIFEVITGPTCFMLNNN